MSQVMQCMEDAKETLFFFPLLITSFSDLTFFLSFDDSSWGSFLFPRTAAVSCEKIRVFFGRCCFYPIAQHKVSGMNFHLVKQEKVRFISRIFCCLADNLLQFLSPGVRKLPATKVLLQNNRQANLVIFFIYNALDFH